MRKQMLGISVLGTILGILHAQQSSPTVQLVAVDKDVKLEVLDWGGSGPSLVLLTGLGATAHAFDQFAPKLTSRYHVYGITRRGFGGSSIPASGYSADRLGDDVAAVLDSLNLKRPVLVGASLGGEELSSVGSRHAEKVAGLIYLDAGYAYAYYDAVRDSGFGVAELQQKLKQIEEQKTTNVRSDSQLDAMVSLLLPNASQVQAILAGMQKYTNIRVPILAIFAFPHDSNRPADEPDTEAQINAFEKGLPSARVVRLPHANHVVFVSNELDVLREMATFLDSLP
jgi:non-heme chloroperoxidase